MIRLMSMVAGLAVLALVVSPVICADAPAAKEATSKPVEVKLGPYYGSMISGLKLDDATKSRISEKVQALEVFNKANKAKLEEAHKALIVAREAKDEAAATKARQEAKALELAGRKFSASTHIEINALLTSEQRLNWEAIQMVRYMREYLRNVTDAPTDAQSTKILDLAKGFAKDMVAARDAILKASAEAAADTRIDENSIKKINMEFRAAVRDQVLTDSQKADLEKTPGEGKAQPKAAQPKTGEARK